MATFLGRAAERSPRLVAVDDLHWLEADSAHVIEFAVRRQDRRPVAVLAAARTGEGELPRPFERMGPDGRVERTHLGQLTPD
jgi:predicted ATPase